MLRRTKGLARTAGRTAVIAGTATAVSGHVARNQQARQAQEQPGPASEPQPPASPDMSVVVEQLKSLADLKDQGILSEEEFSAQKAKLLDS